MVFGLFLAYESRNVKYYYINDSRFVSIAMYIVVILVGIGAPLSLVLAVHFFTDAAYGLAVFMVIASALSCMLIIFVPKVRVWWWPGVGANCVGVIQGGGRGDLSKIPPPPFKSAQVL